MLNNTHTQMCSRLSPCSTESWEVRRGGTVVEASYGPDRRERSQSAAGRGLDHQDLQVNKSTVVTSDGYVPTVFAC